jgi:ketosteroid isomerase-like protein
MSNEIPPVRRERNLATVATMYAAFGAGDIPTVVAQLDEQVEWSNRGPDDIAYFGVKHGHEGAVAVFAFLGEHVDISVFDPHTIIGDGDHVVALVRVAATAKATGLAYDEETVHVFDFNDEGRVVRFRDYQDTEAGARALRG